MANHDDMPRHGDPTEIEPRPQAPPMYGARSTTAQLKQDIDSGATGEKVAMIDPAMSPLGTDDEAAGAPPTPEMIHAVREAERMANPPPGDPGKRPGVGLGPGLLMAIIVAVLLGLGAAWIA